MSALDYNPIAAAEERDRAREAPATNGRTATWKPEDNFANTRRLPRARVGARPDPEEDPRPRVECDVCHKWVTFKTFANHRRKRHGIGAAEEHRRAAAAAAGEQLPPPPLEKPPAKRGRPSNAELARRSAAAAAGSTSMAVVPVARPASTRRTHSTNEIVATVVGLHWPKGLPPDKVLELFEWRDATAEFLEKG